MRSSEINISHKVSMINLYIYAKTHQREGSFCSSWWVNDSWQLLPGHELIVREQRLFVRFSFWFARSESGTSCQARGNDWRLSPWYSESILIVLLKKIQSSLWFDLCPPACVPPNLFYILIRICLA